MNEPGAGEDAPTKRATSTSSFGVSRRENHDSSDFYARFTPPTLSTDDTVNLPGPVNWIHHGDARAPDYLNEDFSIIRNFRIKEAATFQIKAELLNAFNRHIFSIPDTAPNDSNFGVVNGTINAQRIVQFTARINF